MATKRLKLEDFIAPTLLDEPTKLFITLDGKKTKEYLLIIGSTHPDLKRPIASYGVNINKLKKECNDIKDEIDKVIEFSEGEKQVNKDLASKMVVGWSLGDFDASLLDSLLKDNEALVSGIQAHSFTVGNYIKKK